MDSDGYPRYLQINGIYDAAFKEMYPGKDSIREDGDDYVDEYLELQRAIDDYTEEYVIQKYDL